MTGFRVTQSTIASKALAGLQGNVRRLESVQDRLSSGKQLRRPSDSPSGALVAMQHRAGLRRLEQQSKNASDALSWLGTTDAALTSSLDLLRRTRDLALSGVNAAAGSDARRAIAAELDVLRESLVSVANTRHGDRPVFAGTAGGAVAYDQSGTYLGDVGTVERSLGEGADIVVNFDGPSVFGDTGAEGSSVFEVLRRVAERLRSGDDAAIAAVASTDISELDGFRARIQNRLSTVGARYNRVETMRNRIDESVLSVTTQLSQVEDIDLPKTVMELQLHEVAYQAALAASARALQPSLVDFLR